MQFARYVFLFGSRCLAVCLLALCALPALAADLVIERAVWKDDSAQATYAQAIAKPYKVIEGVLSGGYSAADHWVRLRIAAAPSGSRWVLRIRPSYLDEITLFDPAGAVDPATGTPIARRTGDRQEWGESDYQSLNHGFEIPAGSAPRDIYLRLRSTSTQLIFAEVVSVREAIQLDRQQELLYSAYLGFLVLCWAWGLIYWWARRERLLAVFVVRQVVVILHALAFLGYLRVFLSGALPATSLDWVTSFLVMAAVASGAVFEVVLQLEFRPGRLLWWCLGGVLALVAVANGFFFSGHVMQGLHINMLALFLGPICLFVLALFNPAWRRLSAAGGLQAPSDLQQQQPLLLSRGAYVLFYALFLCSHLLGVLPALGWVHAVSWILNGPVFSSVVTGVLMVSLLQLRANNQGKLGRQAMLQVQAATQQALAEHQRVQEQTRFLAMLTHELKTPLAVVRTVLGAPNVSKTSVDLANHAISDMSDVIERCVQASQMDDQQLVVRKQPVDLSAALATWSAGMPTVRLHVPADVVVHTDPQLLRILVGNLLNNAAKYSLPSAPIDVVMGFAEFEGAAGVQITVSNLPASAGWPDAARVFDRYYRSPGAHQETGSGLGLYLVRGIAHMLGGNAQYTPSDTHIIFAVWIPA